MELSILHVETEGWRGDNIEPVASMHNGSGEGQSLGTGIRGRGQESVEGVLINGP